MVSEMPIILTLDIDWAPDFMIDYAAEVLLARGVKATWFVTHESPAVGRLREHPDLFELGIHPNFAAGSTQGATPEAVLDHCLRLVPHARCMRTHGLVQSTRLLQLVAATTAIEADVSLYLPRAAGLRPVDYPLAGRPFVRLPYVWEDDFEMLQAAPWWNLAPVLALGPGLKVLDFHPVHVYLNSPRFERYEALRDNERLYSRRAEELSGFVHQGSGPRAMFLEAVEHLARTGRAQTIGDLCRGECARPAARAA